MPFAFCLPFYTFQYSYDRSCCVHIWPKCVVNLFSRKCFCVSQTFYRIYKLYLPHATKLNNIKKNEKKRILWKPTEFLTDCTDSRWFFFPFCLRNEFLVHFAELNTICYRSNAMEMFNMRVFFSLHSQFRPIFCCFFFLLLSCLFSSNSEWKERKKIQYFFFAFFLFFWTKTTIIIILLGEPCYMCSHIYTWAPILHRMKTKSKCRSDFLLSSSHTMMLFTFFRLKYVWFFPLCCFFLYVCVYCVHSICRHFALLSFCHLDPFMNMDGMAMHANKERERTNEKQTEELERMRRNVKKENYMYKYMLSYCARPIHFI